MRGDDGRLLGAARTNYRHDVLRVGLVDMEAASLAGRAVDRRQNGRLVVIAVR